MFRLGGDGGGIDPSTLALRVERYHQLPFRLPPCLYYNSGSGARLWELLDKIEDLSTQWPDRVDIARSWEPFRNGGTSDDWGDWRGMTSAHQSGTLLIRAHSQRFSVKPAKSMYFNGCPQQRRSCKRLPLYVPQRLVRRGANYIVGRGQGKASWNRGYIPQNNIFPGQVPLAWTRISTCHWTMLHNAVRARRITYDVRYPPIPHEACKRFQDIRQRCYQDVCYEFFEEDAQRLNAST